MEKALVTYTINEDHIKMIIKSYFKETYGEVVDSQIYDTSKGIQADIRVRQDIHHV